MGAPAAIGAIEVYPAATLRSSSLPIVDYRKPAQLDARQQIIDALPDWIDIAGALDLAVKSADVLDAVLCLVAAVDFCLRRAVPPQDKALAAKEGWIWAGATPATLRQ